MGWSPHLLLAISQIRALNTSHLSSASSTKPGMPRPPPISPLGTVLTFFLLFTPQSPWISEAGSSCSLNLSGYLPPFHLRPCSLSALILTHVPPVGCTAKLLSPSQPLRDCTHGTGGLTLSRPCSPPGSPAPPERKSVVALGVLAPTHHSILIFYLPPPHPTSSLLMPLPRHPSSWITFPRPPRSPSTPLPHRELTSTPHNTITLCPTSFLGCACPLACVTSPPPPDLQPPPPPSGHHLDLTPVSVPSPQRGPAERMCLGKARRRRE